MANILIASLGDSPVVVTAMYNLLMAQEKFKADKIEKVIVLQPQGGLISYGFKRIRNALQDKYECEVTAAELNFEDANSEAECYEFLRHLYRLLDEAQKSGDTVYLSLAGGRKNMSAIMALLVPLFPCIEGLYHVLDTQEASRKNIFKSLEDLIDLGDEYLFPDPAQLTLVEIPYNPQQQVSDEFRAFLYTLTPETLDELWEKDPNLAKLMEHVQSPNPIPSLKIFLTERVKDEYQRMRQRDALRWEHFATCFEQMKNPDRLKAHIHGFFSRSSRAFHFYKRNRTAERPFYYTEPKGIHLFPKAKVEKVIISGLSVEREGNYEPTHEEQLLSYDPAEQVVALESISSGPSSSVDATTSDESILLVPLGETPMIATQLYTLLSYQGRSISEVVLLYPGEMQTLENSADVAKNAFEDEGITCRRIPIPGLKDIASKEDCKVYEKKLEETIDKLREQHPGVQIDLALSGGRKGMAALAMFVAQRKGIRHLYHTLINEDELNRIIEKETTVDALKKVTRQKRNERLFLRAYEGAEPYTKFVCFKIPVLPGGTM